MLTTFPFPILYWQPLSKTSLPCKMLFHACEPPLVCFASINVQFGKKCALKTLGNNESEFFKSHHTCFANKESLNMAMSLNSTPPSNFDFVNSSQPIDLPFFPFLAPPKFLDNGFNFMAKTQWEFKVTHSIC